MEIGQTLSKALETLPHDYRIIQIDDFQLSSEVFQKNLVYLILECNGFDFLDDSYTHEHVIEYITNNKDDIIVVDVIEFKKEF
jgi:hypothetical protein